MTLEKTKHKYMRIAICGSGWGAYIYAHRVQRVKEAKMRLQAAPILMHYDL